MSEISRKASLKELGEIPGVGPRIAENLWRLGLRRIRDLKGRNPEELYQKLSALEGRPVDRCTLYVFRCAVYYASQKKHSPEKLKWWNWKDKKKGKRTP